MVSEENGSGKRGGEKRKRGGEQEISKKRETGKTGR